VSSNEPLFQPRSLAALIAEQGHNMENWVEHFTDTLIDMSLNFFIRGLLDFSGTRRPRAI
jgi:hypothetical protein